MKVREIKRRKGKEKVRGKNPRGSAGSKREKDKYRRRKKGEKEE